MKTKAELRKIFKAKRAALSAPERDSLSMEIKEQVKLFCEDRPELEHFHLFFPIERLWEINTFYIMAYLQANQKIIYSSQIDPVSDEMKVYQIAPNSLFELDRYGIPQASSSFLADGDQLQVVFIPLLAIDTQGNRVGYGKGYYDRFLSKLQSKVLKVGLSFFEPMTSIPSNPLDVPCDYCITPNNIIKF